MSLELEVTEGMGGKKRRCIECWSVSVSEVRCNILLCFDFVRGFLQMRSWLVHHILCDMLSYVDLDIPGCL